MAVRSTADENACAAKAAGVFISENGRQALKNASVTLRYGEMHALLGDSGSGSTALLRALSGSLKADRGELFVSCKTGYISAGGGTESLTASDNLLLYSGRGISGKKLIKLAGEYAARLGITIDFSVKYASLDVQERLYIQLLGSIASGARLLLLDKPVLGLAMQQAEELFALLHRLSKESFAILYSTDVARDALSYSDKFTALCSGTTVGTFVSSETALGDAEDAMLGADASAFPQKRQPKQGDPIYTIQNLFVAPKKYSAGISNLSLTVYSGEIVGIASLKDDGGKEAIGALCGLTKPRSGRLFVEETEVTGLSSVKLRAHGIAVIPDYIDCEGTAATVGDLIIASAAHGKGLGAKAAKMLAGEVLREAGLSESYTAKTPLSILSKAELKLLSLLSEIKREPKVLLIEEPLAAFEWKQACAVARRLIELRDHGNSIMMLSSSADMLLGLADRIVVLSSGETAAVLYPETTDEDEIGAYMMGARRDRTV